MESSPRIGIVDMDNEAHKSMLRLTSPYGYRNSCGKDSSLTGLQWRPGAKRVLRSQRLTKDYELASKWVKTHDVISLIKRGQYLTYGPEV